MIYHRGTYGSYGLWAEQVGDDSYQFQNILPFFQKSVNLTPANTLTRPSNATTNLNMSLIESASGPLHVTYPLYAQPLSSYGPDAFGAAGFPPGSDFISGTLNGSGYFLYTIDPSTSIRSSAESAFLSQVIPSEQLTTYINSQVSRIVFDSQKRANGVQVHQAGQAPYNLTARREVILSAGVVCLPSRELSRGSANCFDRCIALKF